MNTYIHFLEYVCYSLQLCEENGKSVYICTDGDPSMLGSYSGFTDQHKKKLLLFNNHSLSIRYPCC